MAEEGRSLDGRPGIPTHAAEDPIAVLFRQHYPRLVQTLCFTTLDAEAAADAAQDAFLQLYLHWDRVSGYDNAPAWLYRVAINRARDQHRRSLRFLRFWEGQAEASRATETEAAAGAAVAWEPDSGLIDALRGLPERQRQAVSLHYVAGLSQKETAETMGLSEGAVKSHLSRARETLRGKLEVES